MNCVALVLLLASIGSLPWFRNQQPKHLKRRFQTNASLYFIPGLLFSVGAVLVAAISFTGSCERGGKEKKRPSGAWTSGHLACHDGGAGGDKLNCVRKKAQERWQTGGEADRDGRGWRVRIGRGWRVRSEDWALEESPAFAAATDSNTSASAFWR